MKKILLCIGCSGKIKPRAFLKKKSSAVKIAKFALKKAKGKKAKLREIEVAAASVKRVIEDISVSKKASLKEDFLTEVVLDMRVKNSNIFLMEIPVYSCQNGTKVEVGSGDRIVLFALSNVLENPEEKLSGAGDLVALKFDDAFSGEKAIELFCAKCVQKSVSVDKEAHLEEIAGLDWSLIKKESKKDSIYFLNELEFAFLRVR